MWIFKRNLSLYKYFYHFTTKTFLSSWRGGCVWRLVEIPSYSSQTWIFDSSSKTFFLRRWLFCLVILSWYLSLFWSWTSLCTSDDSIGRAFIDTCSGAFRIKYIPEWWRINSYFCPKTNKMINLYRKLYEPPNLYEDHALWWWYCHSCS